MLFRILRVLVWGALLIAGYDRVVGDEAKAEAVALSVTRFGIATEINAASPHAQPELSATRGKASVSVGFEPDVPISLCVVQDQTWSSTAAGVPQLRPDDLLPVIDAMRERGGELALATVRQASNVPLLRLRLSARPNVSAGQPTNLIARARGNVAEHQRHRRQLDSWYEEVERSVTQFIAGATKRLNADLDKRGTDLWSPIRRCDAFLGEAGRVGQRRIIVAITDGIDTTGGGPRPLEAGAEVFLVPGTSVGKMAILSPVVFESVTAAFREVVNGGRER